MIYVYVIIITIILAVDIYFELIDMPETMVNVNEDKNMIKFDEPNPWTQIYIGNHINKYYLKINNIKKYKQKLNLDQWEQIPFIRKDLITNDDEMIIIITNNEKEALVIANILVSYMLDDLTLDDIIKHDLINSSLQKAQRYALVVNKLKELIKEGVYHINRQDNLDKYQESENNIDMARVPPLEKAINKLTESIDYSIIKNKQEEFVNDVPVRVNNQVNNMFNVMPYEGAEFAAISF